MFSARSLLAGVFGPARRLPVVVGLGMNPAWCAYCALFGVVVVVVVAEEREVMVKVAVKRWVVVVGGGEEGERERAQRQRTQVVQHLRK